MKKIVYWFFLVIFCGAAAALFFYTTPDGVGLTNDSAAYIGGARSLMARQGYVRVGGDGLPRPITHFPPFYSIVLAVSSRITKMDPLETAKWVNLCCAVLNQALFMTAVLVLTGSGIAGILGGLVFLCAGPVLQAHVYGLSEALYVTLFLAVFILSVRAVRKKSVWMWLLIGLLSGALALTRYAGLAAVAAVAVYIVCASPTAKQRIESLLLYLAVFNIPFGYWLSKSSEAGESGFMNRSFALHLPSASKVEEGIRNFAGFFLPEFGGIVEKPLKIWGILIAVGLVLLVSTVIWFSFRGLFKQGAGLADSALFAPALHGAAYAVMLGITVCFIDGSTLFDNRILLPFYVCAMLMITAFCARFLNRRGAAIAAVIVMLGFAAVLFEDEIDLIQEFHRNGQGMAGREWKYSETRLAALDLPNDRLLFSNRQTALYLLNDQPSFILPPMFDAASFAERESFEADKAWMAEEVLDGNAYVIVFNYQEMMEDEGDRLWLDAVLEDLPILGEYKDGAIFGL